MHACGAPGPRPGARPARACAARPPTLPQITDLPARELVPGDMVELHVGDRVPADIRVFNLRTATVRVEQASLTGAWHAMQHWVAGARCSAFVHSLRWHSGARAHSVCMSCTHAHTHARAHTHTQASRWP